MSLSYRPVPWSGQFDGEPNLKLMKKLMTICVLFIVAFNLHAQDEMDVITTEICDCIKGEDFQTMSPVDASAFAENCVSQSALTHLDYFTKGVDLANTDEAELTAIYTKKGEEIAMSAAQKCPAFLELMIIVGRLENEEKEAAIPNLEVETTIITGKITDLEKKDFFSINVAEADGREHKLYWMEHFEGAMKLKNDQKKNVGKNVKVSYKNVESYNPKLQDYSQIKVITNIAWE